MPYIDDCENFTRVPLMSATTVLHVGDDLCYRIPLMESAGIIVHSSEPSLTGIISAFDEVGSFSAVAFHNAIHPPLPEVVSAARSRTPAPFVLFDTSVVACQKSDFDLVIHEFTPPDVWLARLHSTIEEAQKLRAASRILRGDSSAVRDKLYALRAVIARNLIAPVSPLSLWLGKAGKTSGDVEPEPKQLAQDEIE
jgi:hypothetical protein